jgi:Ca2+:H+ antiporter
VGRWILWASLALAPVTIVIDRVGDVGKVTLFILSAASLIPLAWLIGESTEHAAEHTGPGIGGFLNASFGNAPELIIALFAVSDGLSEVVRGSLSGSIVSNLLLVFGLTQLLGTEAPLDRKSLAGQLGLVVAAVVLFLPVVVMGYSGGSPERHTAVVVSVPISIVLLVVYLASTTRNLHRHRMLKRELPAEGAWSLPTSLAALAVATVATAFVSEILVHSLDAFARAIGVSEFFIATVIVAIVGNSAEHGGAIVIARAGKMKLATEIAVSSAAQVGLLVVPVVMLASLAFSHPLPLTFRWVEIAAIAGGAALAAVTIADGKATRREGMLLLAGYIVCVVAFYISGNRY